MGATVKDLLVILVVEDEALILMMVETILQEGGFKVEIAHSAEEAIRMIDVPDARYRALVTDIDLHSGKLTGWDVARHAREVTPNIPVVYMTAASADDWTSQGVPNSVLVNKPFAPAQILTAVSQLLNAGTPPSAS